MNTKADGPLQRFVTQIPSVLGSALGASVAAQTGDAITGAAVGQIFTSVGEDFVGRVLSPREEARIETTMRLALEHLNEMLEDDETELRSDGLFEPGAEGDEILEGVLNAARRAYQEKKLPYIANVFAWVAVNERIDARTAHMLITEAEAISWSQMCLIALVAEPERWRAEDFDITLMKAESWSTWTVQNDFEGLQNTHMGSPMLPDPDPKLGIEIPRPDDRLKSVKLNNRGTLLAAAMGLTNIPDDELAEVRARIVDAPRRAADDQESG